MDLVTNQTSDGAGAWTSVPGDAPLWFEALGTFDTATVHLEFTRDYGTTVHELTTATSQTLEQLDVPMGQIRARVSSSGASTDVTARI